MSLFITVGSTGFDNLIETTTSHHFLRSLELHQVKKVVYQYGTSERIYSRNTRDYIGELKIEGYAYKSSIEEDMREADIIIGHAGAGTILQSLRMKKKLIVVMNSSLMDNHQNELAEVMHSHKYALCSHTSALLSNIVSINTYDIQPFPDSNPEIFAAIVNQQMNIDNKH